MSGSLLAAYTAFHVLISLVGIATGFVLIAGFMRGQWLPGWNKVFLITTIGTSVTGFGFPNTTITPGIVIGILSLIILAVALVALYPKKLQGGWRTVYVVSAILAQYLNFFVLIAQSFKQIPPLHALAPEGNEPPFAVAQGVALLVFLGLGYVSVKRFKSAT